MALIWNLQIKGTLGHLFTDQVVGIGVEPSNKGHFVGSLFCPSCKEVVLFIGRTGSNCITL